MSYYMLSYIVVICTITTVLLKPPDHASAFVCRMGTNLMYNMVAQSVLTNNTTNCLDPSGKLRWLDQLFSRRRWRILWHCGSEAWKESDAWTSWWLDVQDQLFEKRAREVLFDESSWRERRRLVAEVAGSDTFQVTLLPHCRRSPRPDGMRSWSTPTRHGVKAVTLSSLFEASF